MPANLIFLHTAPVHIATFDQLVGELAPGTPVRHLVAEHLLAEARQTGITPELRRRISAWIGAAAAAPTDVFVCTCSTIGAAAEQAGQALERTVVRVDRAMAEEAIALGTRILAVAALESTLEPTHHLLAAVAAQRGSTVELQTIWCADAWEAFERGALGLYHARIAACIRQATAEAHFDAIVLAQASMAGAAQLCTDIATPILSSPRLGLQAALSQC